MLARLLYLLAPLLSRCCVPLCEAGTGGAIHYPHLPCSGLWGLILAYWWGAGLVVVLAEDGAEGAGVFLW